MKTRRRVRFSETDASGRVHFTQILKWAEDAEHDFLADAGVVVFANDNSDSGWPRAKVSCDYRAPLGYRDEVEVEIILQEARRTSLRWSFEIRKLSPESLIAATGEIVTVWVQEGQPSEIPAKLRALGMK